MLQAVSLGLAMVGVVAVVAGMAQPLALMPAGFLVAVGVLLLVVAARVRVSGR